MEKARKIFGFLSYNDKIRIESHGFIFKHPRDGNVIMDQGYGFEICFRGGLLEGKKLNGKWKPTSMTKKEIYKILKHIIPIFGWE